MKEFEKIRYLIPYFHHIRINTLLGWSLLFMWPLIFWSGLFWNATNETSTQALIPVFSFGKVCHAACPILTWDGIWNEASGEGYQVILGKCQNTRDRNEGLWLDLPSCLKPLALYIRKRACNFRSAPWLSIPALSLESGHPRAPRSLSLSLLRWVSARQLPSEPVTGEGLPFHGGGGEGVVGCCPLPPQFSLPAQGPACRGG